MEKKVKTPKKPKVKLIGKDGIKSLTNDTQTLMKQQLQLADSMKAIGPLIEGITPLLSQVQGMMGGLDINSLEGIKSFSTCLISFTSPISFSSSVTGTSTFFSAPEKSNLPKGFSE